MKKLTIAALLAGQALTAAQPAFAAEYTAAPEQKAGAFAGFRLRLPLDGPQRRQVRAGLAIAPTLAVRGGGGEIRTRIGEGLEYGYRTNRPLSFSIAGADLNGRRLGAAQGEESSNALPRIGLAVLAVGATLGLLYWGVSEALDCDPGDEC